MGIYPNVGVGVGVGVGVVVGVGVGAIKAGRYPCCCWYQNNGVNTLIYWLAPTKLLLSCWYQNSGVGALLGGRF